MQYRRAAVLFMLSAILISIRPVLGYSRISDVWLYTWYQAEAHEEVPVDAVIRTGNNRIESVHEVQVVLLLPLNASLVSGENPVFVGTMGPGIAYARCQWTVKFDEPGEYTLLANASCLDTQKIPRWMIATATIQIYGPPHAEFEYSPSADVRVNELVVFNATKSHPRGPNSTIVAYAWDFGDGTNSTTEVPMIEHTFSNIGSYVVALNVTDDKELSNQSMTEIAISLLGDINFDGSVDILDISIIARAFDSTPSDPSWNPKADVNNDGLINILDISLVAKEYGKTV